VACEDRVRELRAHARQDRGPYQVPIDIHNPKESSWELLRAWPGESLAVQLAMSETAVQDADQAVGLRAESLVVCLTTSTVFVVVAPSTWRPSQRRVRPAEAGIDEMAVARDASEHGVACARRGQARSCPLLLWPGRGSARCS
jgi:hypothetical protein